MERSVERGVLFVQVEQLRLKGLIYFRTSRLGVGAKADQEQEHVRPDAVDRGFRAACGRTYLVDDALFQIILGVRVSAVDHKLPEELFEFLPRSVVEWGGLVDQPVPPARVHVSEFVIAVV